MITRPCKWIYFTYPSEGDSEYKEFGIGVWKKYIRF